MEALTAQIKARLWCSHRILAIRPIHVYRTVSAEAACALAGTSPWDLEAEVFAEVYRRDSAQDVVLQKEAMERASRGGQSPFGLNLPPVNRAAEVRLPAPHFISSPSALVPNRVGRRFVCVVRHLNREFPDKSCPL